MTEKIKCNSCDELATVHLTQIINNKIHKIDLCEKCAQKQGIIEDANFSFPEILSLTNLSDEDNLVSCNDCGLNIAEFKKSGRFGCTNCYRAFSAYLRPILEEMHKGSIHIGKTPINSLNKIKISEKICNLRNKLNDAISLEAYEEAAKYRDEVESLVKKLKNPSN